MACSKDYVNIDLLTKNKTFLIISTMDKYEKEDNDNLKKDEIIYNSSDGIVKVTGLRKDDEVNNAVKYVNRTPQKVYKSYKISSNDTLESIIIKSFNDYPNLKKYYTPSQLMNEIKSANILFDGDLNKRSHINIPYYVEPILHESYDDYEDYYVRVGIQNFYQIVLDRGYTRNPDEVMRLADEIKLINGIDSLVVGSTIKIPSIEKYYSDQKDSLLMAR